MRTRHSRTKNGFTLVELLVVFAILAVLATMAFVVGLKQIDKGKKVQALGQFRELATGMGSFIAENQKPPIPDTQDTLHADTVYGDPGGEFSTAFIVAVLRGNSEQFPYQGVTPDPSYANSNGQQYLDFPLSLEKKKGVGPDGKLYDPWGREMMIAVNSPPYNAESAGGTADKLLFTRGIAEYSDTKPREQEYVFWSFGKDGKKGKGGATPTALVPLAGSDDVVSWQ